MRQATQSRSLEQSMAMVKVSLHCILNSNFRIYFALLTLTKMLLLLKEALLYSTKTDHFLEFPNVFKEVKSRKNSRQFLRKSLWNFSRFKAISLYQKVNIQVASRVTE